MNPKDGTGYRDLRQLTTEVLIELLQKSARLMFPGQTVWIKFNVDDDTGQHLAQLETEGPYRDDHERYCLDGIGKTPREALEELRRRFWEDRVRGHLDAESVKINKLRQWADPEAQ